jgi:galactose oxidase-like protein/glyoxal oxidase-like protein
VAVAAAALVVGAAAASPAMADHPSASPAVSEARLTALEARLLGASHAAEHALQRRRARFAAGAQFGGRLDTGLLSGVTGSYAESESHSATAAVADPRAEAGAWSAPFALQTSAIHAAVLPTGKVLFFGPPGPRSSTNWTHAVLWDPATGTQKLVNPPLAPDPMDGNTLKPANIYCSGQALLADGQLLIAGGTLDRDESGRARGLKKVFSFNPFDETWTEQPDMQEGRWYPTQTLLPDGRQVIISGAKVFTADDNNTIELFIPAPNRNQRGTVVKLDGVRGQAGQPPTSLGDLYPHMFVMPSGRTMLAGPSRADSWYLNTPGNGGPISWTDMPDGSIRRTYGNSVLLPPAPGTTAPSTKVMQIGGFPREAQNDMGLASTESFDEAAPTASWTPSAPLQVARAHQNTVLLPDGSMVAVGGGTGPSLYGTTPDQRQVELFDPATRTWRLGAAQTEPRAYHSVAVLLPDGRVVSAGDDGNSKSVSGAVDTAEIYEPPYLFKGARPTIGSAPASIDWGQTFGVETPDTDIDRAVLIAPGATTHAADMHQRFIPLALTRRAGGVDLKAPANANGAPPGYYMLFLVNSAGVPSIAKFVQITAPPPPPPPPPPPGKSALLVVLNAASVGAGDAAVRARLEGLGYSVVVRSESVAASEATGKDVVVISSTVASGSVNTKFRASAVPVVTWEHALLDDMGMTGATLNTDFGWLDGQNSLRVLVSSHPLAAGLSGTPVVASSPQGFTWGRPGAAAVNVAAMPSNSTRSGVFGYTTGSAMFGLSAPARRVGLFLSNNGLSPLTADGAKLFDAAIRWADD